MKRLILSISSILLNSIFAQKVNIDTVWKKTYGGSSQNFGYSIKEIPDDG